MYGYSNIVIRNLTIRDSSEDNIGIHYANHIWIDHCTIVNATDGGIDITQQSDDLTFLQLDIHAINHAPSAVVLYKLQSPHSRRRTGGRRWGGHTPNLTMALVVG